MNSNNSIFNLGDKEEMSLEEFFDRIPEYDDDDDEMGLSQLELLV